MKKLVKILHEVSGVAEENEALRHIWSGGLFYSLADIFLLFTRRYFPFIS